MTGNMPLDEVEKRSILEAVNACGGNKSEAAAAWVLLVNAAEETG